MTALHVLVQAGIIAMKPKFKNRSNVLLILGALFSIGGTIRFLPTNLATAEEIQPIEQPESETEGQLISAPPGNLPDTDQVCFSGDTAAMLIEDQKELVRETQELQEQKLSLQTWQEKLNRDNADLQAIQKTLEDRWQQMQNASNNDIQHLAQMYRAMKPDQAASIFNQMDPGFAAGFLRLMPSDQAGLIMARMQTSKAYIVSVKLASMNDDIRLATVSQQMVEP